MAYALFFNIEDLNAVATRIQDSRLPNRVRQDGRVFWNGGMSSYQTAPRWPVEYPGYDSDPNGRIVVMDGSTLAEFRAYLYATARDFPAVADWVRKAADAMADAWGAVEPWPYTAGINPWAGYARLSGPSTTTTPPITNTTPPITGQTTTTRPPG